MNTFKRSIRMFKYNLSSVILFQIVFRLMLTGIMSPIAYFLLNRSIELSDVKFLTVSNFGKYLRCPFTYIFLLLILVVFALFLILNMSAMIYAMDASFKQEKISPLDMLQSGLSAVARAFHPKNLGILFFVVAVFPITNGLMISKTFVSIKVPEFILNYIYARKYLIGTFIALYILTAIFFMMRIFAINYYSLYKINFRLSKRMSRNITKRNMTKIIFGVILYNALISLFLLLLGGTLATAIMIVLKKVLSYKKLYFMFDLIIQALFLILYFIFSAFASPLIYAYISSAFYEFLGKTNMDDMDEAYREAVKKAEKRAGKKKSKEITKWKNRLVIVVIIIVGIIMDMSFIQLTKSNRVMLKVAYSTRADVTAHRGDSKNAPENTMAAFEMAVENQADYLEIDVRQTKDGEYIIMHDESLYRTTGIRKKVGEVDYDYIKTLDAGSKFSEKYAGEHIPTLEEVVIFAKENDITLNIELKPAKTDKNYVEGVVELLNKNDYLYDCVIGSQDYRVLKELKSIDPDIETVYIMGFFYGNIEDMDVVDIFSVKHSCVTPMLVNTIHKEGKEIYVWTVDKETEIKPMLLLDVDNIITNNPYNTKDIIKNANDTMITDWFDRLIEEY